MWAVLSKYIYNSCIVKTGTIRPFELKDDILVKNYIFPQLNSIYQDSTLYRKPKEKSSDY